MGFTSPWKVGDRIVLSGLEGVLVRIDPDAAHGMGSVTVRNDMGHEVTFLNLSQTLKEAERPEAYQARVAAERAARIARMAGVRMAHAYKKADTVILHPVDDAVGGIGLSQWKFFVADGRGAPSEIGAIILEALAQSRREVPMPTTRPDIKPLVKAAGATSYKQFKQGTLLVSLWEENGQIRMTPSRNDGKPRGGWTNAATDRRLTVGSAEPPEQIGRVLLESFGRCQ